MGLDSVELVIGIEKAFGINIPDAVASEMITPRHTIEYVASTLAASPVSRCHTQKVFYRLRSGFRSVLGTEVTIRPATTLREIVGKRAWADVWSKVRETAGNPIWPERIPRKRWIREGPETLRELTYYVAMFLPPPDLAQGEPWTRERIELIVRRVVWETIRVQGFKVDDGYVRDMGVN
jgi:hypothetical protein